MDVRNPSPQAVLAATVSLTSAQIKALAATPFQLVPAPGAGKIVAVIGAAAAYKFGTIAYSSVSDVVAVRYAGDTAQLTDPLGFTGLLTAAQSSFGYSEGLMLAPVLVGPGDDNKAVVLFTSVGFNDGPIVTATLGAAGTGYAIGDTGTIVDGSDDATYIIDTVGALGVVLTFHVTGAGTDYTVENGVATATGGAQPGVGVGFTVNITAVRTGDGTLKVTTFYSILPVT